MNEASNTVRLARQAGVPCPTLRPEGGWSFAIWQDGPRWGHIDVTRWRVTEFDAVASCHRQIFPAAA